MSDLEQSPRLDNLEAQILQLRTEMRDGFSATRTDLRGEFRKELRATRDDLGNEFRKEMRALRRPAGAPQAQAETTQGIKIDRRRHG